MLDRAVWLILGVALGTVGSTYLYSPSEEQSSNQPNIAQVEAIPSSGNLVSEPARTPLEVSPEKSNGNRQPHLDLEDTIAVSPSNIPAIYNETIGLPRPKRLRLADRHAAFLLEPRDEAWASAMESGVRNYIADNGASMNIQVEFVECRSEHCEIAGYVLDGRDDDLGDLVNGLKKTGWWQGGLSSSRTAREIGGVKHVVIIFNRSGAWRVQ